jgi:hypothetical protein
MFSLLHVPKTERLKPAGAEFWHVWTVIFPRRSTTGRFVRGRVWRRQDGSRWQYRTITEFED